MSPGAPPTGNVAPRPTAVSTPIGARPVSPSGTAAIRPVTAPPFELGMKPDQTRWFKLLVYSKPGGGKTTLLGTAADVPHMKDVLFIDAESGELAIEDNPRISKEGQVHLIENRIRVSTVKQVGYIYEWLVQHVKDRDANNLERMKRTESALRGREVTEPVKIFTVMIDSLTDIEKYNMMALLGLKDDMMELPDPNKVDDIDTATWDEFKKNNQIIQMLLRRFRDLPVHLLVACGETYSADEMKAMYFNPALTGKLASQVQGFFDIVGRITIEPKGATGEFERKLWVQPIGRFSAKNRRAMFKGTHFVNPTMHDIMKGIGLLREDAATA
jgi:hypothetical protein